MIDEQDDVRCDTPDALEALDDERYDIHRSTQLLVLDKNTLTLIAPDSRERAGIA